jgi:class 3 adenylate cyclase
VAGIVGRSKFIYDILGDTLNIARIIHTSAEQNIIQVTQSVYDALGDLHQFQRVNDIQVKGKGSIAVWAIQLPAAESEMNGAAMETALGTALGTVKE